MIYQCGNAYIDLGLLEVVSDINNSVDTYFFQYQVNGIVHQSPFYDSEVDVEDEKDALIQAWKDFKQPNRRNKL